MASYKNYTSAWITHKGRWEVYDPEHNLVYTSKNFAEDPLHYYVDNWAHLDSTLSPPVTPGVRVNARGFTAEQERIIAERSHLQQSSVNHPPAQDLSHGFFGTGEGIGTLASATDEADAANETLDQWLQRKGEEWRGTLTPPQLAKKYFNMPLSKLRVWWKSRAQKHGTTEPHESGKVLGPEKLQGGRYDPAKYKYGQTLNYLDFETVGTDTTKGSILSYAAIKKAYNLDTGNWDIVSKRTRYYYPTDEDKLLKNAKGEYVYDESVGISGLTDENIDKRRREQLARYSRHFTDKELQRLVRWLGKDPVVGQNISQFDWPKMFKLPSTPGIPLADKWLPPGGLIDTLHIAEGTRGPGKGLNTNSFLFELAYGMTPEEAGFTAHDALEDVQITALVFEAMRKSKGRMGVIARYLVNHPGLSTQWRDTMMKGITEVRGMTPEQLDVLNNIMGDPEGNVGDYIENPESSFDGSRHGGGGKHVPVADLDFTASIMEISESVKAAVQGMKDLVGVNTGLNNISIVKEAAKLGTVEARRDLLSTVFTSNDGLETALKQADIIHKARYAKQGKGGAWDSPTDMKFETGWNNIQELDIKSRVKMAARDWSEGDNAQLASKGLQALSETLKKTNNLFVALNSQITKTAEGIYKEGSYFVPSELRGASDRYFGAYKNAFNLKMLGLTRKTGLASDIAGIGSSVLGGVLSGAALGPAGMLVGGLSGLVAGGIGAYTNYKTNKVASQGADIMGRIDLWSGFTELLLVPLRLAASALRNLSRISLKLGSSFLQVISNLRNLGLPLTNLTGVTYADMQRSYVGDAMIGARNGSINNAYNSWANAQMSMYNYGQMDTDRVIAAAMTGTFGSVYGNGGDTQAQYASTLNTIYARMKGASPQEKQRLMFLAGKIDNTMPATLQQMDNLDISDYRDIQSGAWMKRRGIRQYTATKQQRAAYSWAGMEYTALSESIGDTKNMVATRLWNAFGKNLMSGVNDVFRMMANGDWKSALESAKQTISNFWSALTKEFFGKEVSVSDVGKGILNAIENIFWKALPTIADVVGKYVEIVGNAWANLIHIIAPMITDLITRLSFLRVDFTHDENGFGFKIRNLKLEQQENTARPSDLVSPHELGRYVHNENWLSALKRVKSWNEFESKFGAALAQEPMVVDTPYGTKELRTTEEVKDWFAGAAAMKNWDMKSWETAEARRGWATMYGLPIDDADKIGFKEAGDLEELIRTQAGKAARDLGASSREISERHLKDLRLDIHLHDNNGEESTANVDLVTGKITRGVGALKDVVWSATTNMMSAGAQEVQ